MNDLTEKQQQKVKTLISLGDSEELAIATVLAEKEKDYSVYLQAYYS